MATAQEIRDYATAQGYKPNAAGIYEADDGMASRIYNHATTKGYTDTELDTAFGWKPGTSVAWTTKQGLAPLTGPAAQNPANTTNTATPPATTPPATATTPAPTQDVSAAAQEIMRRAMGAAPDPGSAATIQAVTPGAVTSEVPYEQTSAGIVAKLLQEDGDYLKRARATAREEMAGRGLLSSSIAAGAATGAAIDRAGALATNDSQIYSNQRIANMNATNEMANANANRSMQASQFNAQGENDFKLAKYNAGVNIGTAVINSTLRKDEAAFGNTLTQSNMNLQSYLDKDVLTLKNEFDKGNMNLQNYLDLKKIGYGHTLSLSEMGYGAQLDLMKMAESHGFDLSKMAVSQGYTLEQMSTALGFDLKKMEVGQGYTLDQMAKSFGYDAQKMATAFGYDKALMEAKSSLDLDAQKVITELNNKLSVGASATLQGKGALANYVSQYTEAIRSVQTDPNMDAATKSGAILEATKAFNSNIRFLGSLYTLDITSALIDIAPLQSKYDTLNPTPKP